MAQVTDPVLLKELERQGIDPADVDFDQDYASRSLGKRHSPYAKFYTTKSGHAKGRQFAVFSGLPMVDADGVKIECGWRVAGINYFSEKNNLFRAKVQGQDVELIIRNDQPDGRKANDRLSYKPQLFLNGIEQLPQPSVLLPVDPVNPNYLENTIEWDYGICKRRLRLIEGSILGNPVISSRPSGIIRIKYNQVGDFRLRLGQFAISDDEEQITPDQCDELARLQGGYPVTVSDSATFYPNAHIESTSVDGSVNHWSDNTDWATIRDGAGTDSDDTTTAPSAGVQNDGSSLYRNISRVVLLFDTSGLPDNATGISAVLSVYGSGKGNSITAAPSLNIYSSAPASNTALVAGDYDSLGTTAFSTAIAYADYSTVGYNAFTLNAAGIAAIPLSPANACAKFGLRIVYDATNNAPGWVGAYYQDYLGSWSADKGTVYKPKLVVTYTASVAYDVDAAVLIGEKTLATRIANYPRTAAVLVGELVSATRLANYPRLAAVASGLLVSATRLANYPRASAVLVGELVSATRLVTFTRTTPILIGELVTATRLFASIRVSPVLVGIVVTASAVKSWTINAAVSIGELVSASRIATFTRVSSVLTGILVLATRIWDGAIFTASVLIGEAVSATRLAIFTRVAAVSDGLLVSATRLVAYTRVSPILTGLLVSATRVINYPRLASVQVGELVVATRAFTVTRVSSVTTGMLVVATRLTTYTRASSVITGLLVTATRVYGRTRTASVKMGMLVIGRLWTRMKRRLAQVGTNRDIAQVGTNRDITQVGTNRDIEPW